MSEVTLPPFLDQSNANRTRKRLPSLRTQVQRDGTPNRSTSALRGRHVQQRHARRPCHRHRAAADSPPADRSSQCPPCRLTVWVLVLAKDQHATSECTTKLALAAVLRAQSSLVHIHGAEASGVSQSCDWRFHCFASSTDLRHEIPDSGRLVRRWSSRENGRLTRDINFGKGSRSSVLLRGKGSSQ